MAKDEPHAGATTGIGGSEGVGNGMGEWIDDVDKPLSLSCYGDEASLSSLSETQRSWSSWSSRSSRHLFHQQCRRDLCHQHPHQTASECRSGFPSPARLFSEHENPCTV